MRIRLFFLVLMASFGYFTLGLALAWPASALPSIRASLNLTLEQQSWVGSSPSFGGFVGSVLSGFTAKTLGARRGILLCSVVACLGWFLVFLAASLSLIGALFPGIFLIGFSCGFSNPLTSVYVSETVGWGNKGMVTAMFNCQITFGTVPSKSLVSREFSRIFYKFHFSFSDHFNVTFHLSKKVKALYFSLLFLEKKE